MEADGYGRDHRNHTIFTCLFVVMVAITSIGL